MRTFALLFVFAVLPLCISAQANTDTAYIRKRGILQLDLYTSKSDSIAMVKVVYDKRGRMKSQRTCLVLGEEFRITYTEFDTLGRITSDSSGVASGRGAHRAFALDRTLQYSYTDSSSRFTHTAWRRPHQINFSIVTTTISRWEVLPQRKNRPPLYPDSLCVYRHVTRTRFDYHYTDSLTKDPVRVDTLFLEETVERMQLNPGKISGYSSTRARDSYGVIHSYNGRKMYSLYGDKDTIMRATLPYENRHGHSEYIYITSKQRNGKYHIVARLWPETYTFEYKTRTPWREPPLTLLPQQSYDWTYKNLLAFYRARKVSINRVR